MSRERRGFARLYIGIEATYREQGKDDSANDNVVLIQDISIGGVRFICNEALKESTILSFTLDIPDISGQITAKGKVIWQKRFSESFFDTGIEFVELDDLTKNNLTAFIEKPLGRVVEKREFVRCNLSTMISYRLKANPQCEYRALIVDISPSGLRVFLKESLEQSTVINLSFNLPDDPEAIFSSGNIIWVKSREEKFFEAGIEFVDIEQKYAEKINSYVRKTLGIEW